ncbi:MULTISPECIES: barstar family protein [unclassified Enterobacter]|jgi:ribonuclease inhibitor|uniref:barstar family protein n=1 Tax=unclassified Enterobacter TaxID=2608935 RepID=UPI0015C72420|nr:MULTISPECIES: barstar family protein [unclassified Enterobacter]MBB3306753.1 ribonuclease inhibitor [Enterobacter sp. Sphag1F]NYI15922.1 ribonuclease inhibitor [Enterobacter sp. Sphag71]
MSKNDVVLDGLKIFSESDVHRYLADLLDFGPYYGSNLDALWDRLSTDVERPVKITWVHSELSKQRLGDRFDKIIQIFERTKKQDIDFSWDDKFDYVLE